MTDMERIEKLESALRRSIAALDDWLHIFAPELSDEGVVTESYERVADLGTIGYIADAQKQNREALNHEAM
jgi:hypothetical protein